ncbi:hypothetical protein HMPREF1531_00244 [Propionibacterium sp. oral taxon 192 str. F0372]|uniref:polymorphic toxin type 24 domain-containing protein n=1 Tax=Propionibacterium sp. oral taxon 192 TaxID=671222 RepID=UPI0003544C99|nr:polymorphic toxin type 24 domain-containing protein [Propionibacterium sp. oral taxon 192]EPH07191.1 hypothetical protein HMPREF1531_00244 [Propionibacterium sp. oral taxon 192 str. F0372]
MGLPLPSFLRPALGAVDVTWPECDETRIAEKARAWHDFNSAAGLNQATTSAAVVTMMGTNTSPGLTAFSAWWQRVGGAGGHMQLSAQLALVHSVSNFSAAAYLVTYKLTIYYLLVQHYCLEYEVQLLINAGYPEAALILQEVTEKIRVLCREAHDLVLSLLNGLGVDAAGFVGQLCQAAIELLDARPIHNSPDGVHLPEDTTPITERLAMAQESPRGRRQFPPQADPGTVYVHTNAQTGEMSGYAVYGADGYITKRVDLTGRAHYDKKLGRHIETPHVVYYTKNTNPTTGVTRTREDRSTIREAYPEEIP